MDTSDAIVGRTLLDRYRVVLPLAEGGMGSVYLARAEGAAGFAKPAVVKRVLPELVTSRTTVELFVREAKILANLHHPGIVNVLDFGTEDGAYVMVLEYVHGYDLGAWAAYSRQAGGAIPCELVIYLVLRILESLHYAHEYRGPDNRPLAIVHRDVSPGNVLLALDGQVKLGDFGIARITDDASEVRTQFGTFRGKIGYAAPELLEGDEATPAADVYSAGVVLLELVLGTNPYAAPTVTESLHRVLGLPPPRVEGLRSDIPRGLDSVLARALAKTRDARFGSAATLADAMRALLTRPVDQIAQEYGNRVRADFTGNMAEVLGLQALADRDRAWREAQPEPDSEALGSTPPPTPVPGRPPLHSLRGPEQPTVIEVTVPRFRTSSPGPAARSRSIAFRALAWSLLGVVIALGSAGILWRTQARAGREYVVIERQSGKPTWERAWPSSHPALAQSERTSDSGAVPPLLLGTPSSAPPTTGKAAPDLSRAVQRQQARIQACFEKHVTELGATPQVILRFELDGGGKVKESRVQPAALAPSPLGLCLIRVARDTQFPAPGHPVSFRVPITARVTSRAQP